MGQKTHKRRDTLKWAFRGLLTLFGVIALLIILGILGIVVTSTLIFNPFILIVTGIAIIAVYAMMKNPKEVK